MKYIYALFLALGLTGCAPSTPEEVEKRKEAKIREVQDKIDSLNQQVHACDQNDGVKDISHGRYGTTIYCNNGMSKTF